MGGRERQEGTDVCTHRADSAHRTVEASTTLKSCYMIIHFLKLIYVICSSVLRLIPTSQFIAPQRILR